MSTVMEKIEQSQLRSGLPELRVGSSVRVNYRITEGNKERIQAFEGVIIGKHCRASEARGGPRGDGGGAPVEHVRTTCGLPARSGPEQKPIRHYAHSPRALALASQPGLPVPGTAARPTPSTARRAEATPRGR